jgi:hypothetical protein
MATPKKGEGGSKKKEAPKKATPKKKGTPSKEM